MKAIAEVERIRRISNWVAGSTKSSHLLRYCRTEEGGEKGAQRLEISALPPHPATTLLPQVGTTLGIFNALLESTH